MTNSKQRWRHRTIFYKIRVCFLISKRRVEEVCLPPPPPRSNCVPVSVDEYASISLNTPKYPWKCFSEKTNICYPLIRTRTCAYRGVRNLRFFGNKLLTIQGSEYAWSSGSKCVRVLKMARLYMQGLNRFLDMS